MLRRCAWAAKAPPSVRAGLSKGRYSFWFGYGFTGAGSEGGSSIVGLLGFGVARLLEQFVPAGLGSGASAAQGGAFGEQLDQFLDLFDDDPDKLANTMDKAYAPTVCGQKVGTAEKRAFCGEEKASHLPEQVRG
ncbi:hypothetical protein [Nocardia sp. NPDC057030]|uniref:hypothetical protein n=1 Tax=unclassified Nocardia TaxID=2637762 RepID=UPI00363D95A9